MSAVRPLLIAALFAFTSLAAMPMATAQAPECIDFPNQLACTVDSPSGNVAGGADNCWIDGSPTAPAAKDPCFGTHATITLEDGGETLHIKFNKPLGHPELYTDGDTAIEDLYLNTDGDLDGDGDKDQREVFSCVSNPFNPASDCEDTDGDGLEYYTQDMSASQCAAAGGSYSGGECSVDEETNCGGPGKHCDENDWDSDGDLQRDGSDPYPTDRNNGRADSDGDGDFDDADNCVSVSNADQANFDGDSLGDACDPDDDNDGLPEDGTDPCPKDATQECLNDGPNGCFNSDNEDCIGLSGFCVDSDCGPALNLPPDARFMKDEPWYCDPTDSHASGPFIDYAIGMLFVPLGEPEPAMPDPTPYTECEYPIGPPGGGGGVPDVCEDVFEVPGYCTGGPDPCTVDPVGPIVCGPPQETPLDLQDPWDTDGDGKRSEANGQADVVEKRVAYVDVDEPADSIREQNNDLEGAEGYTAVLFKPAPFSSSPAEQARVHIGDVAGSGARELIVIDGRGTTGDYTCLYQAGPGGEWRFTVDGTGFDATKPNPCGHEDTGATLVSENSVMLRLADENADHVPESFSFRDPTGDGCATLPLGAPNPTTCPYSDPQPFGLPDPQAVVDELCAADAIIAEAAWAVCGGPAPELPCDVEGNPESCLPAEVPCDVEGNPASCVPAEPPCDLEAPETCLPAEGLPCDPVADQEACLLFAICIVEPSLCAEPCDDEDIDGVCDEDDDCPGTASGVDVGDDGCPAPPPEPSDPCTIEDLAAASEDCEFDPEALGTEIQTMVGELLEGTDPFAELPQCEDIEDLESGTYVCVNPPVRPLARFFEPLGVEWPGLLVRSENPVADGLKLNL